LDQSVNPPALGEAQSRSGWASRRRAFFFRPRFLAIAAVLLLGVAYGAHEVYLRFTHIYEYDARATADMVTIASRADGWVKDLPVVEGARVAQGDVVASIDDRVARLQIAILRTQIDSLQARRVRLETERPSAAEERQKAIDGEVEGLAHQADILTAQLQQQQLDIEDHTIKSPVPAVIDRLFVRPGEYVAAGQRILMLHDPNAVWVEANIKETQIGEVKLGQPVHVAVDAYPGVAFKGKVTRIGTATTARFALLPTPNPSGNFTKITQRVPVKIDIIDPAKPLTPGMMVEVEIDIR
jgi:multidrug resistance efflux pump